MIIRACLRRVSKKEKKYIFVEIYLLPNKKKEMKLIKVEATVDNARGTTNKFTRVCSKQTWESIDNPKHRDRTLG